MCYSNRNYGKDRHRKEPNMINQKNLLSSRLKEVAVIAIPVACQNLLSTTGSLVDTMMLATLGETTVSATSMCAQFSGLFVFFYWGFVAGGTMFITQYWGAKDDDGICRAYGLSSCLILAMGLIFGILSVVFPELVMGIYTDKPEIQAIGIRYFRIMGVTFPLQSLVMALSMLLRSIERVRIPLIGGIVAVVSNCCLNYILIFGKLGAPALGVEGAAIGTVVASCLNLTVILISVLLFRVPYALELRKSFRWNKTFVREYFQRSSLIMLSECSSGLANTLVNVVLGRQSAIAISAVAIFRTLENMVWAFFTGFSSAGSIITGKEVGAGNHEVAQSKTVFIVYLTSISMGLICLGILVLHVPLFTLLGLSGESFTTCRTLWIIYSVVAMLRFGYWQQTDCFRSGGDALFGTVLGLVTTYLLMIPGVYIAHFGLHASFFVIAVMMYCNEPLNYTLSQIHLYSRKWIQPVSHKGLATIGAFREKYGVVPGYPVLEAVARILNRKK